jgi:hypothetical protein
MPVFKAKDYEDVGVKSPDSSTNQTNTNVTGSVAVPDGQTENSSENPQDVIKIKVEGSVGSVFAKALIALLMKPEVTPTMEDAAGVPVPEVVEGDNYDVMVYVVDQKQIEDTHTNILGDLSIALDKNNTKKRVVVFESNLKLSTERHVILYNHAYENSNKILFGLPTRICLSKL